MLNNKGQRENTYNLEEHNSCNIMKKNTILSVDDLLKDIELNSTNTPIIFSQNLELNNKNLNNFPNNMNFNHTPMNFPHNMNIRPMDFSHNMNIRPMDFSHNMNVRPMDFPHNMNVRPMDFPHNMNSRPTDFSHNMNVRPMDFPHNMNVNHRLMNLPYVDNYKPIDFPYNTNSNYKPMDFPHNMNDNYRPMNFPYNINHKPMNFPYNTSFSNISDSSNNSKSNSSYNNLNNYKISNESINLKKRYRDEDTEKIIKKKKRNFDEFNRKYVNENMYFDKDKYSLTNFDRDVLTHLKILYFSPSKKVYEKIPSIIKNLTIGKSIDLSYDEKDYLNEIIDYFVHKNDGYIKICKSIIDILTSVKYLNFRNSYKYYIINVCFDIFSSICFIKNSANYIYLNKNQIKFAGIILYKKEGDAIKLLMTVKYGRYSHFYCEVDSSDLFPAKAASKRIFEESRTYITRDSIEERLTNNYIYFPASKHLIYYVQANEKEANIDLGRFEKTTVLTGIPRTVEWIDINNFKPSTLKYKTYEINLIEELKSKMT